MAVGGELGPKNMRQLLKENVEVGLDSGVATGGTNTTLTDTRKRWRVNAWALATVSIIRDGREYFSVITSNTDQILTFVALPGVITPVAGDVYSIRREVVSTVVVSQLTPLEKAVEHNTAELAGVDILAAALVPTNTPCLFRLMVAFNAAGVFSVTITRAANTQIANFNNGAALTLNSLYMFDHLVHAGDTINYRYSANAQLMVLRVQEIIAATQ